MSVAWLSRSVLLELPGAVPGSGPDAGVALHYGDPVREQRALSAGVGFVDRSHRGVVAVPGRDRLSWLHSVTSQHLSGLPDRAGSEALVLSAHGHVENHLLVAELDDTTWLDVEPGALGELLAYLDSMRFLLRVQPRDATAELAVVSLVGPGTAAALAAAGWPVPVGPYRLAPLPPLPTGDEPGSPPLDEPGSPPLEGAGGQSLEGAGGPPLDGAGGQSADAPGAPPVGGPADQPRGFVRRMPRPGSDGADLLVPRGALRQVADRLTAAGARPAGSWAYEALRVENRRPRFGFDTDHRTIPHEVGWIGVAVHLDKGCYRGQETVARVQNLGRPPRRLVLLHLSGESDQLPPPQTPVLADGRAVGVLGTAVHHHELGPVALALVKRTVPDGAILRVADMTAAIEAGS